MKARHLRAGAWKDKKTTLFLSAVWIPAGKQSGFSYMFLKKKQPSFTGFDQATADAHQAVA